VGIGFRRKARRAASPGARVLGGALLALAAAGCGAPPVLVEADARGGVAGLSRPGGEPAALAAAEGHCRRHGRAVRATGLLGREALVFVCR
jgi:hypothetical protein